MTINLQWTNAEKTTALWEFVAPWTWVEFYDAIAEQKRMMNDDQQTIDFVVDFSRAHPLPEQILVHAFYAAYQLNSTTSGAHLDTYIVLIQPGSFLSSLGSVMINRFPQFSHGIRMATSREDAFSLLQSLRYEPDIPTMRWNTMGATLSTVDSISV